MTERFTPPYSDTPHVEIEVSVPLFEIVVSEGPVSIRLIELPAPLEPEISFECNP
jgi:hypothetical protein